MYAVEAVYDGSNFKPLQPIPIKEDYEVIITFVKPIKKDAVRPPFSYNSMPGIRISDDFDEPLEDFKEVTIK